MCACAKYGKVDLFSLDWMEGRVFVCVCGMHEDGAADGYTNIGLKSNLAKVVFALRLYSNIIYI